MYILLIIWNAWTTPSIKSKLTTLGEKEESPEESLEAIVS